MTTLFTATAAALALAILAAAPVRAEPRYGAGLYFDAGERSCPNAATCELALSAISGFVTSLQVTQTSCAITLSNAAKIGELVLRRRHGGIIGDQKLAPIQERPEFGATTRYLVNAGTLLAFEAGDRPNVFLALRGDAVAAVTLNCTVHGLFTSED